MPTPNEHGWLERRRITIPLAGKRAAPIKPAPPSPQPPREGCGTGDGLSAMPPSRGVDVRRAPVGVWESDSIWRVPHLPPRRDSQLGTIGARTAPFGERGVAEAPKSGEGEALGSAGKVALRPRHKPSFERPPRTPVASRASAASPTTGAGWSPLREGQHHGFGPPASATQASATPGFGRTPRSMIPHHSFTRAMGRQMWHACVQVIDPALVASPSLTPTIPTSRLSIIMIIMCKTDTPPTANINIDNADIDNLNMELPALNTHNTPALGDARGCDPPVHADARVAE